VLAAAYPDPAGETGMYYVHSRSKYYVSEGIEVSVLNFSAKNDYVLDGIHVYTVDSYALEVRKQEFDILVCHAPSLRNHVSFLRKYSEMFPRIVFFFHGHEALFCSKVYPKPFWYDRHGKLRRLVQDCYDMVKLPALRRCIEKYSPKSWFIFVSQWMYEQFLYWTKTDQSLLHDRKSIVHNSVGPLFETLSYDRASSKDYDFITVRNSIDGSKYCIDIVTDLARNNPEYTFLVVGQGKFYEFNEKPRNIVHIDRTLPHADVIRFLNKSKCALMPTRIDAQGVMACEMATFGIPVITSDIPVCKEIFTGFDNVTFIRNDNPESNFLQAYRKITSVELMHKNRKFCSENTVAKEVEIFREIGGATKP